MRKNILTFLLSCFAIVAFGQNGVQVTNSGGPQAGKTGVTVGAVGNTTAVPTTDYSWIQSSSGPLLLNPLSGNSPTGVQTNNYVAIGIPRANIPFPANVPQGYNLLVGGKVMCEELKIKLIAGWYDHVFNEEYQLMTLDSLQCYITEYNHLPDVPSAAEVAENGIMAGEMTGILLKKIEELTLYMIEQNKQNVEQSEAMSTQQKQIQLLKEQNELLMQQLQLLISKQQN